ncbi:MAG TPA: hypothetical protein ENN88_04720 [Candidatus Coatesbacteria bacterium]|nr:hypothetical protein [Candidatus Coatesbacteria bacterium]
MAELNLLVRLKVPDTVAASARFALVELLGHTELAALDREELWRFTGGFDPDELLAELLKRTSRFVNPSKHAHRTTASLAGLAPPCEREGTPVGVLVSKRDDFAGRDALAYCRDTLALTEITGVRYSTLWTLWLEGDDPTGTARAMADCSARTPGLLANPHCEAFELISLHAPAMP